MLQSVLRTKTFQHPCAIAHLHTHHMIKLPILDLFKMICSIEWSVDQKPIRAARDSNRQKMKDTGGFLRLFRHVLVEITVWSTDHSIPHHQKPLLHSSNNCKERLGDAQISMCEDTEGK